MIKKHDDFLSLLTSAMFNTKKANISTELNDMEDMSISNYCSSLICQGAVNMGLDIPKSWKDAAMITAINNYKNLAVLGKVVELLSQNNIPCVVIKGITAAVNYPNPMSRALGDIDVLVKPNDYDLALSLFGKTDKDNTHKFHYSFSYEGVSVEIHKYIDDYETSINGQVVSDIMAYALDETEYISFENYKIPCLKKEYQAIVYLSHMLRHFDTNALSMRMFCDWITFVNNIDTACWFDRFYPLIEEAGFDYFSDALCLASIKYMGSELSSRVKNSVSADVVETLMNEFLYEGKSSSDEHLLGNVASLYSKKAKKDDGFIISTFKALNELAYHNFPKISKCKIVLPFCWMYLIVRYFFRVICGKRQKVTYASLVRDANKKKSLKRELKLN